jgi:hypothetical protein
MWLRGRDATVPIEGVRHAAWILFVEGGKGR